MSSQVAVVSGTVTETEEPDLRQGMNEAFTDVPLAKSKGLEPRARVVLTYTGLSRASKQFLERVLSDWAKWHASTYQSMGSSIAFEAGKYEYDPSAIATQDTIVLVDKPAAQTGNNHTANNFNVQYETANQVPKYDRASEAVLQPVRFDKEGEPVPLPSTAKQERRCHNCGSYAHIVQACPKDKDANEIRQRAHERGGGGGNRPRTNTVRYYADPAGTAAGMSAGGEDYIGLQAGQLADGTREALGLGPLDPPPWLDKMRQLGYPPMYKHNKRKDDLFIFDDQTGNATAASAVAAASTSQNEDLLRQGQEMVMFPGVNAPAPPGADARLWGVSLARLPSEAGSKRSQPEYPTQEDVAAAPPLKRIKPNEQPSHPFTFNFQQPGQLPVEYPSSTAAHDQPFVFTAGAQSSGGASRQSSWQNLPGHGIHAGALPPSLTPTGQSTAGSNPFMGLPSIPSGDPLGSTSALPAANVPHNVYPGFAPPAYPVGYAAPTSHMPPHAAAAYGHSLYVMPPSASLPYPYGMHPPSLHTGFPGMHPAYAYTAHAMSTQYPYPPQHSAPYQQTPSMNLQMGSENPPPPPPFPPI